VGVATIILRLLATDWTWCN